MKRLLVFAVAAFAVCGRFGTADTPATPAIDAPVVDGDFQDVVYLTDSRPILMRLRVTVNGRSLTSVWDDYVTKVFRHLDTNGDGFLDKVEVQRLPPPGVLFGGARGPTGAAAPALSDLDADGDGKVSRCELAAYFRRAGYGPFQVAGGAAGSGTSTRFGFVDKFIVNEAIVDLDGQIQLWEGGITRPNTDALNEALFKLLDTNGDGRLTKEKLLAAPAVLLKRDRNDDEIITPDEIYARPGSAQLGDLTGTVSFSYSTLLDHRAPSGPFRLVSAGESSLGLARALQTRYAAKDGKPGVTREQLGLDVATFARLDMDGNGRLDLEELSRFARRAPDLELKIDLGKKPAVTLVKRGAPVEQSVRPGADGSLVFDFAGTRIDLKGLAAPAAADTRQLAAQLRQQYVAEFKKADRDKNGYLDMSEAMRSPFFRNTFKIMDRDGDGKLFENEMLAFLDDFLTLQAEAQASCASVELTTEGKGLFELLDTNGDGRLSVREMRNAVKLLPELDRAGKGHLTRGDIPRCSQGTFRLGPAQAQAVQIVGYAFSPDGASLAATVQRPAAPPRGPEWFRKMDKNGDGDVSRKEFLGTDAQFRDIDTDGDGLISLQEAEAYEKKMREKK